MIVIAQCKFQMLILTEMCGMRLSINDKSSYHTETQFGKCNKCWLHSCKLLDVAPHSYPWSECGMIIKATQNGMSLDTTLILIQK